MLDQLGQQKATTTFTTILVQASEPLFRDAPVALAQRDAMWLAFGFVAAACTTDTFRRALYCLATMRTLDVVDDDRFDELCEQLAETLRSPAAAFTLLRCFADLAERCLPR